MPAASSHPRAHVVHTGTAREFDNPECHVELRSFTLAPGVTRIGDYSFASCVHLSSLPPLPPHLSLGAGCFFRCRRLTSLLALPPSLVSVGASAFAGCHGLRSFEGLPFLASVHVTAFGSMDSVGSPSFCEGLLSAALSLGYPVILSWRLSRALRFSLLACVSRCLRSAEAEGSPLLRRLAALPPPLLRRIATFAGVLTPPHLSPPPTPPPRAVRVEYAAMTLPRLRSLCSSRSLRVDGTGKGTGNKGRTVKADYVRVLAGADKASEDVVAVAEAI
ncbi:hypothetical protein TeGR_g14648 [Tetraparma gracilis]|uniref:Uncharacterized protein n=1 Tax=Tetraparma gracilis TaxID=2962635 RepID=A0ABQ6N5L2_9STRA|nr:hypothetical protein TeGR_g14648 [Tetraparma gracilis]